MTLIRSGAIIFLASMIGNISNYLFQFYMGRRLSLEDYGALNAVFSIMVIVSIPTVTIMLVVAKYVSTFRAKGENGRIASLYRNSLVKMLLLGMVFFTPFLLFNSQITRYLKLDNGWPVIVIGIGLFFSFIVTSNLGMLQGLQKFYYFGAGIGLLGFFKLFFGVVFVIFGFGLNGAVASVPVSFICVIVLTAIPLLPYIKEKESVERQTREILSYSIPVLAASIAFAILTNIDLILVKHIFPPETAGLYSSLSVLGKTILYLPSAFVLALFPIVSESHSLNQDTYRILGKGLVYTAFISIAGVLVFTFFPELILKIMFGNKFLTIAPLLKYYGLAMMFMALINILMNFNLARNRTGFLYSLGGGCLLLVLSIHLFHGSLLSVIMAVITLGFLLTGANFWMAYRDRGVSRFVNEVGAEVV